MIWKNAFLSAFYACGQISLGLILHPYQTMQSLVKDKIFIWMALLPTMILAIVTVLWRYGIVPVVRLVFSCKTVEFFGCDLLPVLSDWITFFCLYWQIILLYLSFRFTRAFKELAA